jgi:hypothetical protein
MTLLKDSGASFLTLIEQASEPTDPASGQVKLYAKDDGTLAYLDDASAEHVLGEAGVAGTYDAADITYTPTTATDWDSDTDPGDVDDALDQLAERVDDLETAGAAHAAVTLDADAAVLLDVTGQEIGLDTQTANYVFAGPTTGAANEPTFRALVQADMPTQYTTLNFVIDGGGSAITTGVKGDIYFEAAYTISAWTLLADASGAIKIDLWMDTYANYPPTDADSITNGHEPEIAASGVKAQDTDIADWTDVTIAAGQSIRVNVDSAATITRCTLALKLLRI